ncbi:MAG: Gfo/Idh/MocA family oxidoreductase [Lachnospiraceae bacterium]|jgi:predicted dehydrogenase|nr:Gfo/Idh/MocA family oxidoreductase [Lachnospiraceae bacterium]MCI9251405.1 Gfo/Idh/MocA family oxidoreductase [Lachnospiraceae bacterium]MCI9622387.1 Gfo/Idh/MocA family oxidoreductase [Lachnospiraceae bacterium]
MIKMAILGAGAIANKMAATITKMDEVEAYAIAARDLDRAQAFAEAYGFTKAYGSYEEMLADEAVDLVYVAVPHSHHYKMTKLCLEAGKHVLCEKAFMVNAEQARDVLALAKSKKLLLTEAIWTRYMPSRKIIDDIIARGEIGEVTSLTANLGYELSQIKRIWDPALAGGALLDVGVYLVNFARMVFGEDMTSVSSYAVFKDGVDMIDSIVMTFEGGKTATMQCNVNAVLNRTGCIFGTKGYLEITNINNPEEIKVYNEEYQAVRTYAVPEQITGYEYEVEACVRAIESGSLECPQMPHAETIQVMEIMDGIRKSWGYEIPVLE